jgi:hypothetical protein
MAYPDYVLNAISLFYVPLVQVVWMYGSYCDLSSRRKGYRSREY